MHAAITDLAANTLDHAKQLIKEMDASGFVYGRDEMVALLYTLQHMHTNKQEQATVDHLSVLIEQLEHIEHEYHDRLYAKSSAALVSDLQGVLVGFHQDHVTGAGSVGRVSEFFQGFFTKPGYRSEIVLFGMLIVLTMWALYGASPVQTGYMVIWGSLAALFVVCLTRIRSSVSGVLATLFLVCGVVWLRILI